MPDKIEQIFKEIHLLFARGEKYSDSEDEVIINKKEMFGLLEELNYALLETMDMYEMNEVKKEQAKHKIEAEGQKIMDEATRSAEEIYAASIMYTDDALVDLKRIMRNAKDNILHEYNVIADRIDKQIKQINDNKDELNMQLQELSYGKDYLRIMQEERKRKAKEMEARNSNTKSADSKNISSDYISDDSVYEEEFIKPDIVINVNTSHPAFKNSGNEEVEESESYNTDTADEDELPTIEIFKADDLDAEFFAWQEEQELAKDVDADLRKDDKNEKKSIFNRFLK